MTQLSTVGVDCPRCDVKIECTLKIEKSELSVPDLADRFAEHYRDAGHVPSGSAPPVQEVVGQTIDLPIDLGPDLVRRAAQRMGLPVVSDA